MLQIPQDDSETVTLLGGRWDGRDMTMQRDFHGEGPAQAILMPTRLNRRTAYARYERGSAGDRRFRFTGYEEREAETCAQG